MRLFRNVPRRFPPSSCFITCCDRVVQNRATKSRTLEFRDKRNTNTFYVVLRILVTRHECFPCSASNQLNTTSKSRGYPHRRWNGRTPRLEAPRIRPLEGRMPDGGITEILCYIDCIRSKSYRYTIVIWRPHSVSLTHGYGPCPSMCRDK